MSNMRWIKTFPAKQIASKAHTNFKAFLHCNLHHCPINTKFNCYKALVRPVIEYSCV